MTESTPAFYRGDYAKASELAMAHLRRFPNDVPVLVILARAEFAQNKFDQALEDLQKALTADPKKNIDALYYLSLVARDLSKDGEPEAFFSRSRFLSYISSWVKRLSRLRIKVGRRKDSESSERQPSLGRSIDRIGRPQAISIEI